MRLLRGSDSRQGGFTLLELMIVVSILAIVASIGIPQYVSALRTARIGKAKHELKTISNAIDAFTANNQGKLPLSLYQVGFGGRNDPWGVPYCYLNYADGTGDGLDWAIEQGLVDPSAFGPLGGDGAGGDGGFGRPQGLQGVQAQVQGVQTELEGAVQQLNYEAISTQVGRVLSLVERATITDAVRSNGSFSIFTGVQVESTRRRDRYMFPLNTDYDLFSLGPDHRTAVSLGEAAGLDDVIRANNGGYYGLASDY
ncbi:MAG: prepilin-type N-terminal cleavage/methylation domain-containing protein [Planctomycetes bacterium]|nr:prepilin-type N-terminal cleavage/methylation domain-containing protein [Planctomycetota bacterium]